MGPLLPAGRLPAVPSDGRRACAHCHWDLPLLLHQANVGDPGGVCPALASCSRQAGFQGPNNTCPVDTGIVDTGFNLSWKTAKGTLTEGVARPLVLACSVNATATPRQQMAKEHEGPPGTCPENTWDGWNRTGQLSLKKQELPQTCPTFVLKWPPR